MHIVTAFKTAPHDRGDMVDIVKMTKEERRSHAEVYMTSLFE